MWIGCTPASTSRPTFLLFEDRARPFSGQAKSDSGEGIDFLNTGYRSILHCKGKGEGTEAGNFQGALGKIFSWVHLWDVKKNRINSTVASKAIRSKHVIGTKSWWPHQRFSLLPHGERSGQL